MVFSHRRRGARNSDPATPDYGSEIPFLVSIQAEILRLYVDVLLIFSSPHKDSLLGRWRLHRGARPWIRHLLHKETKMLEY
jgi:hypothetical protein